MMFHKNDGHPLLVLLFFLLINSCAGRPKETPEYWQKLSKLELQDTLSVIPNTKIAKNVIFALGDGMGITTVNAMRLYKTELNHKMGAMDNLFFEDFPYAGLLKVYSTSNTVAGSASTASAFMTGVRAKSGTINMDDNVQVADCLNEQSSSRIPITKLAKLAGKSVGMVTTARLTHATPATSYANTVDRHWESDALIPEKFRGKCPDIARQFVERDLIDVMLAGGRGVMTPKTVSDPKYTDQLGQRLDGRNLIQEWMGRKKTQHERAAYVHDKASFDKIDPAVTDSLLGLFAYEHMHYEADRKPTEEPSLTEMVEKAVRILSKNPNGFYLFIEGARIDHAHHESHGKLAIIDALEFEQSIQKAVEMTNKEDTLSIATADHSHSVHVAGYKARDTSLFGLGNKVTDDKMPYTTILYTTGPGYNLNNGLRQNLTNVDTQKIRFMQQSAVPAVKVFHSGEDVSIYAQGPWSHLIRRLTEQTYINEMMQYAGCLGEYAVSPRCLAARQYRMYGSGTRNGVSGAVLGFAMLVSLHV